MMNQKQAKRVELAREVLTQLAQNKIVPVHGSYIWSRYTYGNNVPCHTCAIGALIVAADIGAKFNIAGISAFEVIRCLEPYFESRQIALIEAAYESDDTCEAIRVQLETGNRSFRFAHPEFVQARSMFYNAKNEHGKLESIMENIIENDGTFVVWD